MVTDNPSMKLMERFQPTGVTEKEYLTSLIQARIAHIKARMKRKREDDTKKELQQATANKHQKWFEEVRKAVDVEINRRKTARNVSDKEK